MALNAGLSNAFGVGESYAHEFTWTIKKFASIWQDEDLVFQQTIEVPQKSTDSSKTNWTIRLGTSEQDKQKWIGVFRHLNSAPPGVSVESTLKFTVRNNNGQEKAFMTAEETHQDTAEKTDWRFVNVINKSVPAHELPLTDGSLIIDVQLLVYIRHWINDVKDEEYVTKL